MQPDLTSVLAKLRHSESHFQKVKEKIDAWLKSDAYSLIPERNKDLTEWVLIAKLTGAAPDLEQWSLEMGDAITNLRDCLDHLIYAFAQFETRNDPSAQIDKLASSSSMMKRNSGVIVGDD